MLVSGVASALLAVFVKKALEADSVRFWELPPTFPVVFAAIEISTCSLGYRMISVFLNSVPVTVVVPISIPSAL